MTRVLELTTGNLLEAEVEALVNTVNTAGVMGKGIALQFKKAYPENFRRYKEACDAKALDIGQMLTHDAGGLVRPRYVINFPTKGHWRSRSKLGDVEAGLQALRSVLVDLQVSSVAVPPLGCGHGGLRWAEVEPLALAPGGDGLLELRAFPRELGELPAVGDDGRVGDEAFELLVAPLDLHETVEHGSADPRPDAPVSWRRALRRPCRTCG